MVTYEISSKSDSQLVLRDIDGIHFFAPQTLINRNFLIPEEPTAQVTGLNQMRGDWKVFKRTSTTQMKEVDYTVLIQSARISDSPDSTGTYGFLTATEPNGTRHRWQITRFENSRIFTKGDSERSFEVVRADKEMILKEGEITYHFKQFK